MICDLCDKYQQNICERSFHFIKPINECLMRKAQENRQIIEELEKIREKFREELQGSMKDSLDYTIGIAKGIEIIDKHIAELKGENK